MAGNNTRGLGKGLSVLISEEYSKSIDGDAKAGDSIQNIPLQRIISGKYQPRTRFTEEYLNELADSIRHNGVMQPIIVRKTSADGEKYEIIAGERRWRAAKIAGLNEIPAIIREVSDSQALELALVENIQRQDLSPLEEATGYQRLMDEFKYTQEQLSKIVGKSRSHVANLLRLQSLSQHIKDLLETGKLTMGHARALLNTDNAEALADTIVKQELNVRQAENLVKGMQGRTSESSRLSTGGQAKSFRAPSRNYQQGNTNKDADILALEETLSNNLGLRVSIQDRGQSGEITLHYESLSQLDEILKRLGGSI